MEDTVRKVIYSTCIVFNLICVLVFAMIVHAQQRNEGHMFHYLLVKAICDCVMFLLLIFEIIYLWFPFSASHS